jgi:hypothetical protein
MTRIIVRNDYDYKAGTVSRNGSIYAVAELPDDARAALELDGLALRLSRTETPAEWFADVKAGTIKLGKETKSAKVDDWAHAAAIVDAEIVLKVRAFKAPPGKRLRDTADFSAQLEISKAEAAKATKGERKAWRGDADILREFNALTGKTPRKTPLFGGLLPEPAPIAEAAD